MQLHHAHFAFGLNMHNIERLNLIARRHGADPFAGRLARAGSVARPCPVRFQRHRHAVQRRRDLRDAVVPVRERKAMQAVLVAHVLRRAIRARVGQC